MFNDRFGLTQAVLSGRKTMTRRIINLGIVGEYNLENALKYDWGKTSIQAYIENLSKYKVGEVVAIAQSYKDAGYSEKEVFAGWLFSRAGWNNKLFVRANLMPHHIRITDIKVERLQDISDDDCFSEGIKDYSTPTEKRYGYSDFVRETIVTFKNPREVFQN